MPLVMYVGPFDAVEVEHQVGQPYAFTAYRGTPVDVPAHVVEALLGQPSNWRQVVKKEKSPTVAADAASPEGDENT